MSSKWKVLDSKDLYRSGIFRFKSDRCELPDGKIMPNYYVFEFPDWVNVFPVTSRGTILLIKQYRHAAQEITIEVPGGSMHPTDQPYTNHDHFLKDVENEARRELVEETGYDSNQWIYLGYHHPNPALQNNKMHTFIALDCELKGPQELDAYEDIEVIEITAKDLFELIKKNKITNSIVLTSIYRSIEFLKTNYPNLF